MEQLLIFPFNGNGLEALDCLGDKFELLGFIDDTVEKQGKNKLGFEVFGRDAILKFPSAKILAVPGSPASYRTRKNIINALNIPENRFATVVHKQAKISGLAHVGFNVLIMAGVVITSNGKIGNHVCILPNSVIHHDSEIGDYSLIGSNVTVAGNTTIGDACYIGSGTSIINGIQIGNETLIGMGTNVTKSVPEKVKVVGNPGKIIS
jgi:sugar O-acyltransferase (sialic acid O-acetyltransferase NeuD family)